MKKRNVRRRGSALIMVLGILSVMLLMAVAFSTFVRTERGGSTNLKNGIVARASLYSALGRVMEAIDLSYDSPLSDEPVALWPYPWLTSSGIVSNDYFQSTKLGDGESAKAHVLTAEIVKYLSPAQLALARSAQCEWAPILGSINASEARGARDGGSQGLAGRPKGDDLIGRYAFIALETTGLADINNTGGGDKADRKTAQPGDPNYTRSFVVPSADVQIAGGPKVVPFFQPSSGFYNIGSYTSLAEARAKNPSAFQETPPSGKGDLYPADLFAGFSPSLDPLDPDGNPKIHLPTRAEMDDPQFNADALSALARRSYNAMVGVFARARVAAGKRAEADKSEDNIPIFEGSSASYSLSRAALATVALLDGLDEDGAPGQSLDPTCSYWSFLAKHSASNRVVDTDGSRVWVREDIPSSDSKGLAGSVKNNPLNYPCTDSAPLLSAVYAYITIDPNGEEHSRTIQNDFGEEEIESCIEYRGTLSVGGVAIYQNRTTNDVTRSASLTLDWEVGSGGALESQLGASLGGGDFGGDGSWDSFLDMDGKPDVAWSGFFGASGQVKGQAGSVSERKDGDRAVNADKEDALSFKIFCRAKEGEFEFGETEFHPPTLYEGKGGTGDVFVPVYIKAQVKCDGEVVQQVPAPAIANDKKFWIRVDPGVFHGDDSSYGSKKDGSLGGGGFNSGTLSVGWALCAVPTFGFDTTCLATDGSYPDETPRETTMKFWVNDLQTRNGGVDDFGNAIASTMFEDLDSEFFLDKDAWSNAKSACGAGDFTSGSMTYNEAQLWLFSYYKDDGGTKDYHNVLSWMCQNTGRHVPDMLHSATKGGLPFVAGNDGKPDSERWGWEIYTRIPNGYSTVADLGTVMCGPYETLSLFKTWRRGSDRADFHPVVDYFTTDSNRYPLERSIVAAADANGQIDWTSLSGAGTSGNPYKDLYSAAHNGRVNLNAPPLVKVSKVAQLGSSGSKGVRGEDSDYLNPYPIATVLNGAPYGDSTGGIKQVDETTALALAEAFCHAIENTDLDEMWGESNRWKTNGVTERAFVRNLSAIGMGTDTENAFLDTFVGVAKPMSDYDREGLLRSVLDGFTTRGQTFLVIIRADAYSPKFGENDSVEDGTTLATTHAIVELFRDPVPARAPDGSLPSAGSGNKAEPVAYHNWYIRSFRVF